MDIKCNILERQTFERDPIWISLRIFIYDIFHKNRTLINRYPVELLRPIYLEIG